MLRVLLLADPHLVEATKTAQHTATDESTILALHAVCVGENTHPRVGIHGLDVCLQALGELVDEGARACEDDVVEQDRSGVDVDGLQSLVDDGDDGLLAAGLLGLVVGVGGVVVEEAFGDLESFKAEDCVPAVGQLEGLGRHVLDVVAVGNATLACG